MNIYRLLAIPLIGEGVLLLFKASAKIIVLAVGLPFLPVLLATACLLGGVRLWHHTAPKKGVGDKS